jgi:hypothetical protein
MGNLPESSNFYAALDTRLSKQRVAELFRPLATTIRKCAWDEFEILCPWAEVILEDEAPILLHGLVADVFSNAERLLAALREAGVSYSVECYNDGGELLREYTWESAKRGLPSDEPCD